MAGVIKEESFDHLADYARIPIGFEVRRVFEVIGDDPMSAMLVEQPVRPPWTKDYDAGEGEGPLSWPGRWDLSNWGLLVAVRDERYIGGCVLAYDTPGVDMLEGRDDLVVMWDLRVHPDHRGKGVGRTLFEAAVRWARQRGCRELKVETQNINTAACKFYKSQGCRLSHIDRSPYPDLPDEVQLIWSIDL